MKKFIFTLPKKNEDPEGSLKKYLINKVAKKYNWLSLDGIDEPKLNVLGIQYAGPSDYLTFGISTKHNVSWAPTHSYHPAIIDADKFDLYHDFFAAMERLDKYAKINHPFYVEHDYDYKNIFGMPVKVYPTFIQVGYNIIPRNKPSFFDTVDEKTRLTLVHISSIANSL